MRNFGGINFDNEDELARICRDVSSLDGSPAWRGVELLLRKYIAATYHKFPTATSMEEVRGLAQMITSYQKVLALPEMCRQHLLSEATKSHGEKPNG